MNKFCFLKFAIAFSILFAAGNSFAQQINNNAPPAFTAADYARAEKFLGYNTAPLVDHAGVRPVWLADGRFWYRNLMANGSEFVLVNPANGTRQVAFDQTKLAVALSTAAGTKFEAARLPFTSFDLSADSQTISFNIGDKKVELRCVGQTMRRRNSSGGGQPKSQF